LRRGALDADHVAEVDRELPSGPASLREVVDRHHAPHAHVDAREVVVDDLRWCHAAATRPMTFIRRSSAFNANARVSATDAPNSVPNSGFRCAEVSPSRSSSSEDPSTPTSE